MNPHITLIGRNSLIRVCILLGICLGFRCKRFSQILCTDFLRILTIFERAHRRYLRACWLSVRLYAHGSLGLVVEMSLSQVALHAVVADEVVMIALFRVLVKKAVLSVFTRDSGLPLSRSVTLNRRFAPLFMATCQVVPTVESSQVGFAMLARGLTCRTH